MHIKIAERLHPFSHQPGITCLLPRTSYKLQIFPTRLVFKGAEEISIAFALSGPIRDFTVEQDLERGVIYVFGHAPSGFLRYRLSKELEGIVLFFEKTPAGGIVYSENKLVREKEKIVLPLPAEDFLEAPLPFENLSLGMHKAQDWEMIYRRKDMKEVFPIWFRLGQLLPSSPSSVNREGTALLLEECRALIEQEAREEIATAFLHLFQAGFEGILTPRLFDTQFQGLSPSSQERLSEALPLFLVTKGKELIRSLFFTEQEGSVALLPCLPPEFHAGRLLHIRRQNGDEISMEWTKKLLRRLIWRSTKEQTVTLLLQKPLLSFRFRRSLTERGQRVERGEPLSLHPHETVYLDQFQK